MAVLIGLWLIDKQAEKGKEMSEESTEFDLYVRRDVCEVNKSLNRNKVHCEMPAVDCLSFHLYSSRLLL